VLVQGTSVAAITAGLGWYLKYYANCSVAWSGMQMAISAPVPAVGDTITVDASVPWRYYLNTCTHSYVAASLAASVFPRVTARAAASPRVRASTLKFGLLVRRACCCFACSYTMVFWDWPRWQYHIDWYD
jgi:hypothetical protein